MPPLINLDDIPEEFRNLFTEQDGRYTLDTNALSEGKKTAEDVRRALQARDNEKGEAEKLRKELASLREQLGGIDPSRLSEAKAALGRLDELEQERDKIEHERLISEKKFEEAAERKYHRQLTELQRQIETLNQTIEQRQSQFENVMNDLKESRINSELSEAFIQAGVNPSMLPFILEKEAKRWELDPETRQSVPIELIEGGKSKVTAMGSDGKPLTKKEHADTFLRENAWAALPSRGSSSQHQNNTTSNGAFAISRAEARSNNRKYEQLVEQASKVGSTVEFID